jgi:hypothetical protein
MLNTKFLNEQELKEELIEELEITMGKVNNQKVMKLQVKKEVSTKMLYLYRIRLNFKKQKYRNLQKKLRT